MSGKITTHALDLSRGKPAAGMRVELWAVGTGGESCPRLLGAALLNEEGRTDPPLAEGELACGLYELRFDAGGYYGSVSTGFFEWVPVRFAVRDASSHYHVPLLISPGGYSTYRGS